MTLNKNDEFKIVNFFRLLLLKKTLNIYNFRLKDTLYQRYTTSGKATDKRANNEYEYILVIKLQDPF